jgi:RHS repeat-associated protein
VSHNLIIYDALGELTFDSVGNLTFVNYPASPDVTLTYDPLNRCTNMVDAVGTTRYTFTTGGQLWTEDGPFASDTVTSTYQNRLRVGLSLQQPTGAWTNGFSYDATRRLAAVTSPAGAFAYTYTALYAGYSGRLIQELGLPNGAYVTNVFDSVARELSTVLKSSAGATLDAAFYGYNAGNQRTAYTNAAGTYFRYTNDPIGQLQVATSSSYSENRGYTYDAAWNLNYRTNSGTLSRFMVDNKNQLTNAIGGTYSYDANGNLTAGTNGHNAYVYDDENRLLQWFWYATDGSHLTNGALRTDFTYDGLGRLRKRLEYHIGGQVGPPPSSPSEPGPLIQQPQWTFDYGVIYVYDGWRVIQERDTNNVPQVSYTRGLDLSGSLEGAGGFGGLLARSSGYSSGNWTSHAYYHGDGNGNVTCLVASNQSVVASYRYDPFGNTIAKSGSLADENVYRFSSKECHTNSLMYYYGYRFYDPNLQRWLNRDPLGEPGFELIRHPVRSGLQRIRLPLGVVAGGPNLFDFVGNRPINSIDPLGLAYGNPVSGPNGPVGPSDPYGPGWPYYPNGPFYKPSSPPPCVNTCKAEENRCRARAVIVCIAAGIITETGPIGGGACLAVYMEFCKEKYHDSCVDTPTGPYLLSPYN